MKVTFENAWERHAVIAAMYAGLAVLAQRHVNDMNNRAPNVDTTERLRANRTEIEALTRAINHAENAE